jgi:hypothetical protein
MARRHRDQEDERSDPTLPASGAGAFSRESAHRSGGSVYGPHIRAQELSARALIPMTIKKLREMESRMATGSPELIKRMAPAFEEKKKWLARLVVEANAS